MSPTWITSWTAGSWSELLFGHASGGGDARGVRDVEPYGERVLARCAEGLEGAPRGGLVAAGQHDAQATGEQLAGDLEAQAPVGAGDEGDVGHILFLRGMIAAKGILLYTRSGS
jgi:hypothetical protein